MGGRFRSSRLHRRVLVVGACALVASATAQPAGAISLSSETFDASSTGNLGGSLSITCGPSKYAPFTYRARGVAIGPRSGTFVEYGRVVPTPLGRVARLYAKFAIKSPQGNVTGVKRFTKGSGGVAACTTSDPGNPPTAVAWGLCYRARFTGGGTETGRANLGAVVWTFFNFNEQFAGPFFCR